jgi:hypothetical protein
VRIKHRGSLGLGDAAGEAGQARPLRLCLRPQLIDPPPAPRPTAIKQQSTQRSVPITTASNRWPNSGQTAIKTAIKTAVKIKPNSDQTEIKQRSKK